MTDKPRSVTIKIGDQETVMEVDPKIAAEHEASDRVRKICGILGETQPNFHEQVRKILDQRGLDFIKKHLREAKGIQDAGGMLVDDGTRKRTFGELFMYLVKIHWHEGVTDKDINTVN